MFGITGVFGLFNAVFIFSFSEIVFEQQHLFASHHSCNRSRYFALLSALKSNTVSPVAAPNDVTFDILLAEDNLVSQKLAVKILEKYGHSVEMDENGSLAVDSFKLRVAQGRPFDIVMMDVSMPLVGGMEATELIRAFEHHEGLDRTRIIALTAHASAYRLV